MSKKKVKITLVLLMFLSFRAIRKKRFCWIMGSRKMAFAYIYEAHGANGKKSKIEQECESSSK